MEASTSQKKRIDTIWIPINKKINKSVILVEYKVSNQEELDKAIEDAFQQIYLNQYISEVIKQYDAGELNKYWENLIIRVIVFY